MKKLTGRFALFVGLALAAGGCETGEAASTPNLLTATARRGDLLIRAEATGAIEPVRKVEVKSKASGEILRLLADIGDVVERGALLAEIDPRDVQNRFDQMSADLAVARARSEISQAQLDRSKALLDAAVITQQEYENSTLEFANQRANLIRAQTNYDLAELQLADVNIRAPMRGTIIQKNVEEGTVIQSASSNVSGGTALFVMADLAAMQVRTLVDETDMGDLKSGMEATVRVEAFPDRTFRGTVDKIEPQATEVQNVTMFPVIVSLDNRAGLLKPGMNAEVEIFIDEALDVILIPNNAIVQTSDVGPAAMALGLSVDGMDLTPFMQAGRGGGQRGTGGRNGGAGNGDGARGGAAPSQSPTVTAAPGTAPAGPTTAQQPAAAGQADAMARLAELRAQVQSGAITEDSLRAVMRTLQPQAGGGRRGGAGVGAAAAGDAAVAPPRETRPAVVFVLGADSIPVPRLVQLGLGDWDNTAVASGLEEGETLVIVGAAQLQAQQQAFLNQMRERMGGANPFGGGGGGGGGFGGPGGGRGR